MKKILVSLLFLAYTSFTAQNKQNTEPAPQWASQSVLDLRTDAYKSKKKKFIDKLLSKMTLEEKIGQLNLLPSGDFKTGETETSNIAQKIKKGLVGGLFNIKGIDKIKAAQKLAVKQSRLKIPLIFGMDVIHGYETTFPIPLGLASSWDMKLIQKSARIAAEEAAASGISWTFSPMVDLSREPRWGRVAEGAGEDPYLGSQIAQAMVYGYQGKNLAADNTIMACVKHFALYGASEAGLDYNTVDMSHLKMFNTYFPPYKAAVDAGAGSVMASFNVVDGVPATGNKWLLTDVLRNQWGFNGLIVSDYTGINEMIAHGMGNLQQVSALALNAGLDMDMVGEGFLTTLKKSVKEGLVTEEKITQAARKVLEAKYDLGLFQNPYLYGDKELAEKIVFSQKHRDIARNIAAQSMVLLKNKNQILPLKTQGTIAVIGPLVANSINMLGTWAVGADGDAATSLLQGLKETVGDKVKILTAKGANVEQNETLENIYAAHGKVVDRDNRGKKVLLEEAVKVAEKSDVIILAIGESAEMSGESSSRTHIDIPQSQVDLLNALEKTGKPIVMVLFTGRPLALSNVVAQPDAILNAWFPGSEAGYAISDVLFGKVNPSGKLPMTFPRSIGQIPIYYNHLNTGRPLSKENREKCIYQRFKSNYMDECITPLFPFGYGLSYTTFKYSPIQVTTTAPQGNQKITASVKVTNTGKYDGAEVVQFYIRDMVARISRPVKELKGFKKVFLKAGETQTVSFTISPEDLKYYDQNLNYDWDAGEFKLMVGTNSQELQSIMINWSK